MARVLMLARHFPPIGGAGVHRTLGSVRLLPEHGYDPVVVTGPAQVEDRWNPRDPGLLRDVPARTHVHRLAGPEPAASTAARRRIDSLTQSPPSWVKWWVRESARLACEVAGDADVVLASCLPYETAFSGASVARALGKPWVADLEDPWALDEMRVYPSGVHRAVEMRRMRAALSTATAIVMCAPEAAARVRRTMPELAGRVTEVPIGFAREDVDGPRPERGDGAFRIVHTGSMHTDFGLNLRATRRRRRLLGGAVDGVDILPRSHVFLVAAIAALERADPRVRGRVELHLVGQLTQGDIAVAERHAFVRMPGLLSHRETLDYMRSADLLFLPMHDLPPGRRAGIIPYKTYEYLAAERPVLAAVPDGDVRDLLTPLQHVSLVRPADLDGMVLALRRHLARDPMTEVQDGVDSPALHRLDRRDCVARIAAVLDDAVGASAQVGQLAV